MTFWKKHRGVAMLLVPVAIACVVLGLWYTLGRREAVDSGAGALPTGTTAAPPPMADDLSFTAAVTQLGEDWMLVEAEAGCAVSGTVRVLFTQAPALSVGDRVLIRHTGQMMPSLPPQVVAVSIEKC